MPDVALAGCVPDRLLGYLSALGILRLIGRQADPEASGWWREGAFVLRSRLSRAGLEQFFLADFQPTPLLMPWNSGGFSSGKDGSTAGQALERLVATTAPRFAPFREAVAATRTLLADFDASMSNTGADVKAADRKEALLWRCRNELPDAVVEWMDAAVVLTDEKPEYPPLLGTGGNDGRMDFTSNYMQRLGDVLLSDVGGKRTRAAGGDTIGWLRAALFADSDVPLRKESVGQFDPGGAGGPNASAGFSTDSLVNPWQFILALEGALLLAAAATRRLGAGQGRTASMPFTVRPLAVGYASGSASEAATKSRAELWLPVWSAPWTLGEAEQVFNEGRLSIGGGRVRRQAGDAIDVARAITQLGVDRGIDAFYRYAFLQRSGNAYFAVCLGQLRTAATPSPNAHILDEIAIWREQLRRELSSAGPTYGTAVHALEAAMYRFAQHPDRAERLEALLRAMGRAEREAARYAAGALHRGAIVGLRPLQGLSARWLPALDSRDMAVEVALALASIRPVGDRGQLGPFRAHLEPALQKGQRWSWGLPGAPTVVWGNGTLVDNLGRVLERRITEASMHNLTPAPLAARYGVTVGTLAEFLANSVAEEDQRIADLLWAFGALTDGAWQHIAHPARQAGVPQPPNAYAVLKLTLLPARGADLAQRQARIWGGERQPFEPRVVPLLRANRPEDAVRLAGRRLRVDGLPPLATDFAFGGDCARLEASLLIPLASSAVPGLERRVLKPPQEAD